jgi:hypothetical protein
VGIRVHKFLGYGLSNVESKDYKIVDPRINCDSPLLSCSSLDLDDYKGWLDKNTAPEDGFLDRYWLNNREEKENRGLEDCIAYQNEYGLENVLCLQPLALKDWSRYDDSIDYVEETYLRDDPQINYVKHLHSGIHPYDGSFVHGQTGKPLTGEALYWRRGVRADLATHELDAVARLAGFKDHADALLNCVPKVPDEIRLLCQYTELFTNEHVYKQLRPMIYTYWS